MLVVASFECWLVCWHWKGLRVDVLHVAVLEVLCALCDAREVFHPVVGGVLCRSGSGV